MKRFLFAADFSDANLNAWAYAKYLVDNTNIKVDIVNVFDLPLGYSNQTPMRAISGYLMELKKASEEKMNKLLSELSEENRGDIHAIHGMYPSEEIEEVSDDIDADLVIVSLRQDYGIIKQLMGSTTAHTIHKCEAPVLVIPAHANFQKIEYILFPTSLEEEARLSETELESIEWLNKFSGFLDEPEVELIHIFEDGKFETIDIKRNYSKLSDLKIIYSHALSVEEGILNYTVKKKPDLLAFYKPHRSLWERLYRPSKTRQLLYDSNIPLIIF